jgi:hypothetical protein
MCWGSAAKNNDGGKERGGEGRGREGREGEKNADAKGGKQAVPKILIAF